jgi:hypothetical protein
MTKPGHQTHPDVQSYEDGVSRAFLEVRLAEFALSVDDDQLMTALRRTWREMSDAGQQAASSRELDKSMGSLISRALDPDRPACHD